MSLLTLACRQHRRAWGGKRLESRKQQILLTCQRRVHKDSGLGMSGRQLSLDALFG